MDETSTPGATRTSSRITTPAVKQGWGVAGLISLVAIVFAVWAYSVHARTYRHPTDPSFRQVGADIDKAKKSH